MHAYVLGDVVSDALEGAFVNRLADRDDVYRLFGQELQRQREPDAHTDGIWRYVLLYNRGDVLAALQINGLEHAGDLAKKDPAMSVLRQMYADIDAIVPHRGVADSSGAPIGGVTAANRAQLPLHMRSVRTDRASGASGHASGSLAQHRHFAACECIVSLHGPHLPRLRAHRSRAHRASRSQWSTPSSQWF